MKIMIAGWLVMSGSLSAEGLTFSDTTLKLLPAAKESTVVADFKFKNETHETLSIKKLDSGCSCLVVTVVEDKKSYLPNESGIIRAKFELNTLWGSVEKDIAVWLDSDQGSQPSQKLKFQIEIQPLIALDPKTVKWEIGEKPVAKTITMKMNGDLPIHALSVEAAEGFSAEVKTIKDGNYYEIIVIPKSTTKLTLGRLKIATDCPVEHHRIQHAFALIQRKY